MSENCEIQNKPKTVKEFFTSSYFWKPFIATIVGSIGGFLYFYFIGCSTGSCGITSSPVGATLFGGFIGFFLVSSPCAGGCK